jgi:hypothetical protein
MANATINAAEYESWLTPREAINELKPMHFDAATEAIVEHAREGNIRAAAKTISFRDDPPKNYHIVSIAHWKEIAHDDLWGSQFWSNGIIKEYDSPETYVRALGGDRRNTEPLCVTLGVRFEPAGIASLALTCH